MGSGYAGGWKSLGVLSPRCTVGKQRRSAPRLFQLDQSLAKRVIRPEQTNDGSRDFAVRLSHSQPRIDLEKVIIASNAAGFFPRPIRYYVAPSQVGNKLRHLSMTRRGPGILKRGYRSPTI
ncbi:protein of unknown function (plasmid) [Agrobacterium pusense]|uniref:Uncharacterized protein n=1 Tax=Agrobacterium pusense TaxID=648995 RepID=U4Q3W7_9HYPH|nr:protein of unknown function [Agrobacterium pusense]